MSERDPLDAIKTWRKLAFAPSARPSVREARGHIDWLIGRVEHLQARNAILARANTSTRLALFQAMRAKVQLLRQLQRRPLRRLVLNRRIPRASLGAGTLLA